MRLEWRICEDIITARGQFLIRNAIPTKWYGRVIVPQTLREHFKGTRKFRRSLKASE